MLNSGKEIWHRFLYILFLVYTCASLSATILGALFFLTTANGLLFLAGVAGLAFTRLFYTIGCDYFDFRNLSEAFGFKGQGFTLTNDPALNAHIEELHELEEELAELRQHDHDPGFDPWKLQEKRHKIHELLEDDPRLKEFRESDPENPV